MATYLFAWLQSIKLVLLTSVFLLVLTSCQLIPQSFPKLAGDPPEPRTDLDAQDYYQKGIAAFAKEDYWFAYNSFQQAVYQDPLFAKAYFELGRSHEKLDHQDSAMAAYENGLALQANNGKAHARLAALYKAAGEADLAAAHRAKALEYGGLP